MSPPVVYAKTASESPLTFFIDGAKMIVVLAILRAVVGALLAAMKPQATLVAENLALRQQLAVLRRTTPRPRLRPIDRAFWALLSQTWSRWADLPAIVRPATVVDWHRRGFALFWAMKSKHIGRPPISAEAKIGPLWLTSQRYEIIHNHST